MADAGGATPATVTRRTVVRAAGLVVVRKSHHATKVLLIHRPTWDDWVLPKGHVEGAELLPETACREFQEETGYKAVVGRPVAVVDYPVEDTIKRVHWWVGRLQPGQHGKVHNPKEVDAVVWLQVDKALARLTYENERDVLKRALALPKTRSLLIVRHGKALGRKGWKKDDWLRPLAARGWRQARQLPHLLEAYGVTRLASSTSARCIQTLQPCASQFGVPIDTIAALSEESAIARPGRVATAIRRLVKKGTVVAVCGHRPVLPAMVDALFAPGQDVHAALGKADVRTKVMKPGEVLVAHLDAATGQPVAIERYPSKL